MSGRGFVAKTAPHGVRFSATLETDHLNTQREKTKKLMVKTVEKPPVASRASGIRYDYHIRRLSIQQIMEERSTYYMTVLSALNSGSRHDTPDEHSLNQDKATK